MNRTVHADAHPDEPFRARSKPIIVTSRTVKAMREAAGLARRPQRILPLLFKLASDGVRTGVEQRHLYSYASVMRDTPEALTLVVRWILDAQGPDGGVAAYYGLLNGYSESYPEVTGYIVPTLYDYAKFHGDDAARQAAERATAWLLSVQMPSGAFPGGLHGNSVEPSVFNTGQILQGLARAHIETKNAASLKSAEAAGNWLAQSQQGDGSWSGPGAYQEVAHNYYSMVSWALAQLAQESNDPRHTAAADRNIDWVLSHVRPSGWIDGINLRGRPSYLHFIAYAIQGILECGILRQRDDAVQAAAKAAWVLLRKFETHKYLLGTYESDFRGGQRFSCLTGNAQMSCVWLRLAEVTGDLRYLNSALKMNEMLKQQVPAHGRRGVVGGVAGSYPIWGAYQPLRYISWGCKFLADALMLEERLMRRVEAAECGL